MLDDRVTKQIFHYDLISILEQIPKYSKQEGIRNFIFNTMSCIIQ